MKRREFIKTTALAAAALAAILDLPLLAAQTKEKTANKQMGYIPRTRMSSPARSNRSPAYLPTFSPVSGAPMTGAFAARYSMVAWLMAAEKSRNATDGFLGSEPSVKGDARPSKNATGKVPRSPATQPGPLCSLRGRTIP